MKKLKIIAQLSLLFFLFSCNNNVNEYYTDGLEKHEADTINGDYYEYYENGALKISGFYKNQKKDSVWIKYFKNGTIQVKQQFENGIENGFCIVYDEDGNLIMDGKYVNGRLYIAPVDSGL